MSGRKNTEVAVILERSEQGRKETQAAIDRELNAFRQQIQQLQKSAGQELDSVGSVSLNGLGPEAEQEFSAQCAKLKKDYEKNYTAMQAEAKLDNPLNAILKESENLKAQVLAADREAAEIRKIISTKAWYCEKEYAQANALARKYKNIFAKQQDLVKQSADALGTMTERRNKIRQQAEILKAVQKEAANLQEVAKKRKQSNELRSELKNTFNSIEPGWASKFFAREYDSLKQQVDNSLALNDDEFLKTFKNIFEICSSFAMQVEKRKTEWQKDKSNCEDALKNLDEMEDYNLADPVDYYNENSEGKKMNFFAYLQTYAGSSQESKYQELKKHAAQELAKENFTVSQQLIKNAEEILVEDKNKALALQEAMYNKSALAASLENVMAGLGYNTVLTINEDNPDKGFVLTCTMGDEIINFDNIDIDSDNKVIITLDHKESRSGNCGKSWKTIAAAMRQNGIPITDVRLGNGTSVLYSQPVSQTGQQGTSSPERAH